MKKTLIALTVAVSAVASGSAMASDWVPDGSGDPVELGGDFSSGSKSYPMGS